LPDVGQVEADEVFFVALDALLRQDRTPVAFESVVPPCRANPDLRLVGRDGYYDTEEVNPFSP
jgi:hypothetical protein